MNVTELKIAFKYRAFISYSSKDRRAAEELQRFLESYRVPKALCAATPPGHSVPERLGKFFRDRTDAPGSDRLSAALQSALSLSQDLIVVCSEAAASPESWVNREIVDFRRLRPEGRIFAIITSGDPPYCFPAPLRSTRDDEIPLAADMRPQGDGRREAMIKLIAALLGVDFDALRRRDAAAQRRRRQVLFAAASAYVVTITVAALWIVRTSLDLAASRAGAIANVAHTVNEAGRHDLAALLALVALPLPQSMFGQINPKAEAELTRAIVEGTLQRVIPAIPGTIWAMARHPKRPLVVVAGVNGSVATINWETGVVTQLTGHGQRALVRAIAVSPDGRRAATVAHKDEVCLWDLDKNILLQRIPLSAWHANEVDFSPDGNALLLAASDGVARIIEIASGRLLAQSDSHGSNVMVARFSNDGTTVLSSAYNGRLMEWHAATGKTVIDHGRVGTMSDMARAPMTGHWFTTHALTDILFVWAPGKRLPERQLHVGAVGGKISLSDDGRYLLSAHWIDKMARITDLWSNHPPAIYRHADWVDGVLFSHDQKYVITADHIGEVRLWRNVLPAIIPDFVRATDRGPAIVLLTPDEQALYIGHYSGKVLRHDLPSQHEQVLRPAACDITADGESPCGVKQLALAPDAKRLAVVTRDNQLELRSTIDGQVVPQQPLPAAKVNAITYISDQVMAIAFTDGSVVTWSDVDQRVIDTASLPEKVEPTAIVPAPDRRILAIGTGNGQLWLWDLKGAPAARQNWKHARSVVTVAWSPDGSFLATGGGDDTILLGQHQLAEPPRVIRMGGWVTALAFTNDSRLLVAATNVGEVSLWDVQSGSKIAKIDVAKHEKLGVHSVALSQDDHVLYASKSSGQVARLTLNIPHGDIRTFACTHLPLGRRQFTEAEFLEYRDFLAKDDRAPCDADKFPALYRWLKLPSSIFR